MLEKPSWHLIIVVKAVAAAKTTTTMMMIISAQWSFSSPALFRL
jgi:hypothetical protein